MSLSKLYRTSDLLWKHREALETALAQRERSLFDTPAAIVFYDLTNVHYHGRPGGDMQFGRSKQKRSRALHAGLARKGCTKRYDKVLERLGRLKERSRQVAGQYDIAVERGAAGHRDPDRAQR